MLSNIWYFSCLDKSFCNHCYNSASNMIDNHVTVYEFFLIVDLTTYCINSDRNAIIRNDLCLYVQLHYSNFTLNGPMLRYSPING
jgi:hypothetical protein